MQLPCTHAMNWSHEVPVPPAASQASASHAQAVTEHDSHAASPPSEVAKPPCGMQAPPELLETTEALTDDDTTPLPLPLPPLAVAVEPPSPSSSLAAFSTVQPVAELKIMTSAAAPETKSHCLILLISF